MKRLMMLLSLVTSLLLFVVVTDYVRATDTKPVQRPQVKRLDLIADEIGVGPKGEKVRLIKNEELANKGLEIMQRLIDFLPGHLSQIVDIWWFGVIEEDNAYGADVGEIEG